MIQHRPGHIFYQGKEIKGEKVNGFIQYTFRLKIDGIYDSKYPMVFREVNTVAGFPTFGKKNTCSQTKSTIWFSQYFLLLPAYINIQTWCKRRYNELLPFQQAFMNLTYSTLKYLLLGKYTLTQQLYNVIFVFASQLYNLFDYYGDAGNWGYDIWEHLAKHKLVTTEVINNILSVHANAIFVKWTTVVQCLQFAEVVFGYLQQWDTYLVPKPNNESNNNANYVGLYLQKHLNDKIQQQKITSDGMFPNYKAIDDPDFNTKVPSLTAEDERQRYRQKKQQEQVRYHEIWHKMLVKLEDTFLPDVSDEALVQKIKNLDIYNLLKTFDFGYIFVREDIDYSKLSKDDATDMFLHREMFKLQKIFVKGSNQYFTEKGKQSFNYYYPKEVFNQKAQEIIEATLAVKPKSMNSRKCKYINARLIEYLISLKPNQSSLIFTDKFDVEDTMERAIITSNETDDTETGDEMEFEYDSPKEDEEEEEENENDVEYSPSRNNKGTGRGKWVPSK